jgi:hypothetical protein
MFAVMVETIPLPAPCKRLGDMAERAVAPDEEIGIETSRRCFLFGQDTRRGKRRNGRVPERMASRLERAHRIYSPPWMGGWTANTEDLGQERWMTRTGIIVDIERMIAQKIT